MPLFPSRPEVRVHAPSALFIGDSVELYIQLMSTQDLKVDFIDVSVLGKQGWTSAASSADSELVEVPRLGRRLMQAGVLKAGPTRFALSISLPPGTAPSHEIRPAYGRFEVEVHVSVPWWPDGRYAFTLPVRVPPPVQPIERTPVLTRAPFNAKGDETRIELALASSRLVVGEVLVGSLAVFQMNDSAPRPVELSFVPRVKLLENRTTRDFFRANGYEMTITLPAGSAGRSVPFQVRLPSDMVPTFAAASHELDWFLQVRVGSVFSKIELSVPLELLDAQAAPRVERLVFVPQVADQRVVTAFEQFATQHSWVVDPTASERPACMHNGAYGTLRIGYAYRGDAGTFLIGRVSFPRLGVQLSVSPSSSWVEVFNDDVEIDLKAWDRGHRVNARHSAQVVPFLKAVVPVVQEARGQLRWSDDEIELEWSEVSVQPANLVSVAGMLERVARAIADARQWITAPPGFTIDLPAWHVLASWLGGELTIGDLGIDGRLDATPVGLAASWGVDGEPLCIRVRAGSPATASVAVREAAMFLDRPRDPPPPALEKLGAQLATWPDDICVVRLDDGIASASLLLPGAADAKRVRALVRALCALLASLDAGVGPYR